MRIEEVICSTAYTGFFFDDQAAIKAGAIHDGETYHGQPLTPGFSRVRQPGEAVSVLLRLANGEVAWGDCAAVQYSGAGGRDPLFLAASYIPEIEAIIKPWLEGRDVTHWRALCAELEELPGSDGRPLHTAIRYGVSQALLDAVSRGHHELMAATVAREFGSELRHSPVALFTQSGDNRYANADKMILRRAAVLPHGLFNNVAEKVGRQGELLLEYAAWLRDRVLALRDDPGYQPVFHFDVYGTLGLIWNDTEMVDYLAQLAAVCAPFALRLEGPMDAGSRCAQIEALAWLTAEVDRRGIPVQLVADEWCNTLDDCRDFAAAGAGHMLQIKTPDLGALSNVAEAINLCQEQGVGAYQGGSCNETERSAVCCVHVAMAMSPDQMLAKPGMGVDEGFMICSNEMNRILALTERTRL